MEQWNVFENGKAHEVIFEGCKISGKGKFRIDGKRTLVPAVLVKKIGLFYPIPMDESELIVKLDLKNHPVDVIQDGFYLQTGAPLEESVQSALRSSKEAQNPLVLQDRSGMGSLLTFTVLTYLNLFLLLVNTSVSFPFSAVAPQLVLGLFLYSEAPSTARIAVGALISVALTSVYLVLYLLSKKDRLWPVAVALVFAAIDFLILMYVSLDNMASYIIDIAFHGWALFSLLHLFLVRKKRVKKDPLEQD